MKLESILSICKHGSFGAVSEEHLMMSTLDCSIYSMLLLLQ